MLLPWSLCWWLLFLLGLLPSSSSSSRIVVQDIIYKEKHSQGEHQTHCFQQVLSTASPTSLGVILLQLPLHFLADYAQMSQAQSGLTCGAAATLS